MKNRLFSETLQETPLMASFRAQGRKEIELPDMLLVIGYWNCNLGVKG